MNNTYSQTKLYKKTYKYDDNKILIKCFELMLIVVILNIVILIYLYILYLMYHYL